MDRNNFLESFMFRNQQYHYYSLDKLVLETDTEINQLPYCIRVILESALRNFDGNKINENHITQLANWANNSDSIQEVPFKPYRILFHDTTGVPAIVDIAMLRDFSNEIGDDARKINPVIPIDLVIDHSLMVDYSANETAIMLNEKREFERNKERFEFIKWAQANFKNFRVFPPSSGIMHQINLEYLSKVVVVEEKDNQKIIYPDSLVGADSHTTMINGLGIFGYGVGGIEAEAAMLGESLYLARPEVIGFKLTGNLQEGITATDLALTVTNLLRKKGVVGKFIEFYGEGVQSLTVFDRSTIANMAPEYGATMSYFPVDQKSLEYLQIIGRTEEEIGLIKKYYIEQNLFSSDTSIIPTYSDLVELDLSTVTTSISGPKRPQDRIGINELKENFSNLLRRPVEEGGYGLSKEEALKEVKLPSSKEKLKTGSVVLASITSCTNTSNPNVLIAAGLLAKRAIERGLTIPSFVKTSFTPGSKVVTDYMEKSGLLDSLEKLGFNIAGYGCATCIGNSGELLKNVDKVVTDSDLVVTSVLSGNRNFEGRVHPKVKANFLASPPLVIAYALAGTVEIDLQGEPIGYDGDNQPVYLRDLWPAQQEIEEIKKRSIEATMFQDRYKDISKMNENWNNLKTTDGVLYDWNPNSTYIQKPPFLADTNTVNTVDGSRILLMLGDSVTTDHISPSGRIKTYGPAGKYLMEHGVSPRHFNSYPSRRGNFEVMIRAAFANVRLRNKLVPDLEGGYTTYFPTNEVMTVYEASQRYKKEKTPLCIIAGKEYGTGSSRDWAAKGTILLGIKTVIAESFERIHRSNLIGMGVLPLQFVDEINQGSLGLKGNETFYFQEQLDEMYPGKIIKVKAVSEKGNCYYFETIARLDNNTEVDYYQCGGILPYIANKMFAKSKT